MNACCESGYCESEARDLAASEAFGSDWQESAKPLEEKRYISESDVIGGYTPDDYWNPSLWYPGLGYRTLY